MKPNSSRLRILVVEDEPLFAEQIEAALEDLAYNILGPAHNAVTALALVKSASPPPDVALLDLHLGAGPDGVELARQLIAIRPLPLIFLTSMADEASFARARSVGPAAYLVKPVEVGALQRAIELAVANFAVGRAGSTSDDDEDARTEQTREARAVFSGPSSGVLLPDALFVKEEGLLVKVALNDVNWIKADDGLCHFALDKGRTITTRQKLRDLASHLPADRFVQIHRSYIINATSLERLDTVSNIVQVCGQLLPLGRLYRDDLLRRLQMA